jgi:hypothetical protein
MNENDFDREIRNRLKREDIKMPKHITSKVNQTLYTLPTMKQRFKRLFIALIISILAFILLVILSSQSPLL